MYVQQYKRHLQCLDLYIRASKVSTMQLMRLPCIPCFLLGWGIWLVSSPGTRVLSR